MTGTVADLARALKDLVYAPDLNWNSATRAHGLERIDFVVRDLSEVDAEVDGTPVSASPQHHDAM